jgi:hypothetical protein
MKSDDTDDIIKELALCELELERLEREVERMAADMEKSEKPIFERMAADREEIREEIARLKRIMRLPGREPTNERLH